MDLEEYIDSLRKKKPRKILDIDVDEITLCGSAANRKKFYVLKMGDSMKNFNEALKLVEEFLDGGLEKSKVDAAKLKKAMKTMIIYKDDLPDELKASIDVVLKWAAGHESSIKKSQVDDFPSIPIVGPASVLEKMADDIEDDEDEEDDELS